MKHDTATNPLECIEGPDAFRRFDALVRGVISVPHSEIIRREREYQEQSRQNPHRRGPKPKQKADASRRPL